ncbi:c-type cytochrome [Candidatus Kuenenia sp.]|uniref:c-type cytochrome n=1 Tax=Candidatus Kuenenia sp. TaxID=2499824 RepID=UPI003220646A
MAHKKTHVLRIVFIFSALFLFAGSVIPSPSRGEEKAINARNLFEYHCAKCHGLTGEANKRGKALKAPDLCDPAWQNSKTDEEILHSITNGKNKMPAWNERLAPEEIEALARYVRKLSKKQR